MPRGGGTRGSSGRSRSRGYRSSRRKGRPMTRGELIVTLTLFFGVFLFVFLFLAKDGANLVFSPGDSRLFDFSSSCRQITVTDYSKTSPATLYLVTDTPPLTKQNAFTIHQTSLSIDQSNYEYWQYFFYPDSQFNMSACSTSKVNAQFYIIKGSKEFKKWTKGKNVRFFQNSYGANRHILSMWRKK